MKGVWIASLYSFGCPELKQIGVEKFFFDFVKNPENSQFDLAKEILKRLEPFLFYRLICQMNGLTNPFSQNVVRAYWLGNDLLRPVRKEDLQKFLYRDFNLLKFQQPFTFQVKGLDSDRQLIPIRPSSFDKKGSLKEDSARAKRVPIWFSQKIESGISRAPLILIKILGLVGGKAHHNFSVLWLIKEASFCPDLLRKIDNCLVKAGKVTKLKKENVFVKTKSIVLMRREILFEDSLEKIDRGFVKGIKIGDWVSIHLGMAREKISQKSAENLFKITKESLAFFQKG